MLYSTDRGQERRAHQHKVGQQHRQARRRTKQLDRPAQKKRGKAIGELEGVEEEEKARASRSENPMKGMLASSGLGYTIINSQQ